ncbi:MAG: rolling circle replication-associated protein, partial [Limisphaerales bacterium]
GEAAPASALPCLSSNNCTTEDKINVLTGAHKRTAFMVAFEIECLVKEFGIERIGFFTLTFKDHVTDLREAQKRFRSLRAHVIVKRYKRAIGVWERHHSGRIHFHLVVVLDKDVLSGADFAAFKRKDYRSANSALRAEWAFWRQTCPKYRFGRHELMPVKSTAEGIARYVGKYISKHVTQRLAEDKGARVVRFIGYKPGTRRACGKFSWNTANGWLWRHKTATFAERHGVTGIEQMKMHFGSRWAYRLQKRIIGEYLEGVVFPSRKAADLNFVQGVPTLLARIRAKEIQEAITTLETLVMHPPKIE